MLAILLGKLLGTGSMEHRALVRICMVPALAHCGSFFWALGRHIEGNPGIQPNIRLAMGWGDDSSVMLSCMEVAMANTVKPTKEQVREDKDRRQAEPRPPLTPPHYTQISPAL
jgi:hypothetical protein